jgi:hypothetical protein
MQSASQLDLFFETYEKRYKQAGKTVFLFLFHKDLDKLIITFIPNFFYFPIQNPKNLNAVYKPLQCFYLAAQSAKCKPCSSHLPQQKKKKKKKKDRKESAYTEKSQSNTIYE